MNESYKNLMQPPEVLRLYLEVPEMSIEKMRFEVNFLVTLHTAAKPLQISTLAE
jgi:hypothetical protein